MANYYSNQKYIIPVVLTLEMDQLILHMET